MRRGTGRVESLNANQTELLIYVHSSKDFLGPRPNPIAVPPSIRATPDDIFIGIFIY